MINNYKLLNVPKLAQDYLNALSKEKDKEELINSLVEAFALANKLNLAHEWFPNQLQAYFGSWKAIKVAGLYCPEATYKHNVSEAKDLFALGSSLLVKAKRNIFFQNCTKVRQYNSLLSPLIPQVLASFKKYQNIPYMSWDRSKIKSLESKQIAELYGIEEEWAAAQALGPTELLRLRFDATTAATGKRAGIPNNPATCVNRYRLQDTELGSLPALAQYMALQTWAAHPSNATKYTILDPTDWDAVPAPLIDTDLFTKPDPKSKQKAVFETDLPWDC